MGILLCQIIISFFTPTPSLIFFPNLLAVRIVSSSSNQASNLPSIACASAILR